MLNYTMIRDYVGANEIIGGDFSFSPSDFRKLLVTDESMTLKGYLSNYKTGFEIGSDSYINKSTIRFLKTNNITSSFILDTSRVEFAIPDNRAVSPKDGSLLIVKDGGTGGLGEACLYAEDKRFKDYISAGVIELSIKDVLTKAYILGILKSKHFKEYIDNKTPGGSTIRHSRLLALDYEIPLPEKEEVKTLVSLIVQNILDKEQRIKAKNEHIDNFIKEELEAHSKPDIRMPVSTEILENNFRFDSGLYSSEYKAVKGSVEFYDGGYFNLLDKYNAKRGQNLQVSNIGISVYSSEKKDNFYRLVTNVELTEDRTISTFRYLGNKNRLTLIPKNSIMLSADGSVGRCIYVDDLGKTITNIHPWILTPKDKDVPRYENIFTAMFLGYLRTAGYYDKIQDKSNGGGIKLPHLENWIKIPNFPESLKRIIADLYHNPIEKNQGLSLETYLDNEKKRNNHLGIWQLNMELFTLKEQLEKLVHDIVYGEDILIEDYL